MKCWINIGILSTNRYIIPKNVKDNNTEGGTCSEENAESKTVENAENGGGEQPPQKKKRLSNREYKKMMKGQNKVSDSLVIWVK